MKKMRQNKRGAIELSMTTIIVIVIGVTLLILGLAWVRGLFSKTSLLTDQAFSTAEKMIQENMGDSEKFYVSGLRYEIESGDSTLVHVGVQNFGEEGTSNNFLIDASSDKEGCDKTKWFVIPGETPILAGEKIGIPVEIKAPKGTEPGTTCTFSIAAFKDGEVYGSQPIIVKVKE